MIGRDREKVSRKSVLSTRLDDDDNDERVKLMRLRKYNTIAKHVP